ncbi:hypothetical protein [Halobellus ordinarius]|uniref:hypothetical protein n=1 Tax=Halobellus ordinarius TaxID=3075120 RepID=UPI00288085DB|nr:hypothetical protein [Halobellus sp. ZY16]
MPDAVFEYGVREAARRWGDVRKALRLFRQAGETAIERGLDQVTLDCLDANIEKTDKEAVTEKLLQLPFNHFLMLLGIVSRTDRQSGDIIQPVTTAEVVESPHARDLSEEFTPGERAVRDLVTDLETMGLLDTWIESRGRDGRVKQIETTFEPQWVRDVWERYLDETDQIDPEALLVDPNEGQ